jgi:hypothetical protein
MPIRFSGGLRTELPEAIRRQIETDLEKVIGELDPVEASRVEKPRSGDGAGPDVLVLRLFGGHSKKLAEKVIVGIEVNYPERYERHIVKIGVRKKVEPDFQGWQDCTKGQHVASRIFAPVRKFELGEDRVAVLYRDGFTLFGPGSDEDSKYQPKMLDEATKWAVVDDKPDPMSVQRALVHIFTDLGLWFYRGAESSRPAAHKFYRDHLRQQPEHPPEKNVFHLWLNDTGRQNLRRQAVWVLAGCDDPVADPIKHPARYLDPFDYVEWAISDKTGDRVPETLVGRSHGDLHARNVIVGDRRGEVQYPAVFDYGDMTPENVIAWDFAKLETELKVRILAEIVLDPAVMSTLIERTPLRKYRAVEPKVGLRSKEANRADRLVAFLAFEELLDDLTSGVIDGPGIERILPLTPPPTGVKKIDRLASILVRVRCEAVKWLGDKGTSRQNLWKDELHFALGVYGLINVRWNYSDHEQEAALVSAGVAIARMRSIPELLKSKIADGYQDPFEYPSYRVPLAILHKLWQAKHPDFLAACRIGEQVALKVEKREHPPSCKIEVLPRAFHAVPLIGQALLLETEAGNLGPVEPVLERMRDDAIEFGDFETLGRIGRLYKDSGDRLKDSKEQPDPSGWPPSFQMYDMALDAYAVAYDATNDWYVGINAATLARLVGKVDLAKEYAEKVAATLNDVLKKMKDDRSAAQNRQLKKDRYWLYATEGEAALILGRNPLPYYKAALAELTAGQGGMADSSYKQVCRLQTVLKNQDVESVLKLFESSQARSSLTENFLDRKFQRNDPC